MFIVYLVRFIKETTTFFQLTLKGMSVNPFKLFLIESDGDFLIFLPENLFPGKLYKLQFTLYAILGLKCSGLKVRIL